MKLTKEKCKLSLNWFKGATCMGCSNNYPNCYSKCIEKYYNTLDQLINEHFASSECRVESSLTREKNLIINLVSEIDKLEKALDKACELLEKNVTKKQFCVDRYGEFDIDIPIRTKKEWKEYLLEVTEDE